MLTVYFKRLRFSALRASLLQHMWGVPGFLHVALWELGFRELVQENADVVLFLKSLNLLPESIKL